MSNKQHSKVVHKGLPAGHFDESKAKGQREYEKNNRQMSRQHPVIYFL